MGGHEGVCLRIVLDEGSDFEITPEGYRHLVQILKARYCRLKEKTKNGETKEEREKMITLHVQINELEAMLEGN